MHQMVGSTVLAGEPCSVIILALTLPQDFNLLGLEADKLWASSAVVAFTLH